MHNPNTSQEKETWAALTEDEIEALRHGYKAGATGSVLLGLWGSSRLVTVMLPAQPRLETAVAQMARAAERLKAIRCNGYVYVRPARLRRSEPSVDFPFTDGGESTWLLAMVIDENREMSGASEPAPSYSLSSSSKPIRSPLAAPYGRKIKQTIILTLYRQWQWQSEPILRDAVSDTLLSVIKHQPPEEGD